MSCLVTGGARGKIVGMHKPLAEALEVDRAINVENLGGAVCAGAEDDRLYVVRAYGEDPDTEERTSVALIFLPEEMAVVCARIARMMIDGGDTEVLMQTWQNALTEFRAN